MCLKEWQREGRQRALLFPGISPQIDILSRGGPSQNQELGTPTEFPTWVQGPGTWTVFHYFPYCISRKLVLKWSIWDLNKRLHEMPLSQREAYPTLPVSITNIFFVNTFSCDFACLVFCDCSQTYIYLF